MTVKLPELPDEQSSADLHNCWLNGLKNDNAVCKIHSALNFLQSPTICLQKACIAQQEILLALESAYENLKLENLPEFSPFQPNILDRLVENYSEIFDTVFTWLNCLTTFIDLEPNDSV